MKYQMMISLIKEREVKWKTMEFGHFRYIRNRISKGKHVGRENGSHFDTATQMSGEETEDDGAPNQRSINEERTRHIPRVLSRYRRIPPILNCSLRIFRISDHFLRPHRGKPPMTSVCCSPQGVGQLFEPLIHGVFPDRLRRSIVADQKVVGPDIKLDGLLWAFGIIWAFEDAMMMMIVTFWVVFGPKMGVYGSKKKPKVNQTSKTTTSSSLFIFPTSQIEDQVHTSSDTDTEPDTPIGDFVEDIPFDNFIAMNQNPNQTPPHNPNPNYNQDANTPPNTPPPNQQPLIEVEQHHQPPYQPPPQPIYQQPPPPQHNIQPQNNVLQVQQHHIPQPQQQQPIYQPPPMYQYPMYQQPNYNPYPNYQPYPQQNQYQQPYQQHPNYMPQNPNPPNPPQDLTLRKMMETDVTQSPLGIVYPANRRGIELKSRFLHQLSKFHGLDNDDPQRHLKSFHMVCVSMLPDHVELNEFKLTAFPSPWKTEQENGSSTYPRDPSAHGKS
ncbi:hypothetical protein LXL04_008999 [Taraxacum kok-saghyz]